jgi:lipoprotein NlpD
MTIRGLRASAFICSGIGLVALLAAGCTARTPAPVSDRTVQPKSAPAVKPPAAARPAPVPADARPAFYTVRSGDTLYSIALDHGLDYRELAAWNGITSPGAIRAGQQLRMTPPQPATTTTAPFKTAPGVEGRPITGTPGPGAGTPGPGTGAPGVVQGAPDGIKTQPQGMKVPYSDQAYAQLAGIKPAQPAPPKPESALTSPPHAADGDDVQFTWPASGKIVNSFSDAANLKGIGIAGKPGQPVYASAPGRVIFSGTGIRGFGKLIVIKHNNAFLSVYGHNNELLVKEGQNVAKGQKIAEMGNTDADQVKLHFEIRRFGKPVDPLTLLPQQQG